ncbi:TorD/DmsD family molecular chaperone [Desulfovibrio cuneatus]|uniref:TorD/DmsD family molecular chaperone n=1 Tax=Desulfovibrio cuneatus TaxID=159728 RepID=UPI00146FADFE|nr:molecular chaperone TorD family protein [Desulfovibrio cuneatus]
MLQTGVSLGGTSLFSCLGMLLYRFQGMNAAALAAHSASLPQWEALCASEADKATLRAFAQMLHTAGTNEEEYKTATAEYAGVFQNPTAPVPLWESFWVSSEHLYFTQETHEVLQWYRTFGLELVAQNEPADHIGLEMLFVAILLQGAAKGSPQHGEAMVLFWQEHIGVWAGPCLEALQKTVETAFWQAVVAAGQVAVKGMTHSMQFDEK